MIVEDYMARWPLRKDLFNSDISPLTVEIKTIVITPGVFGTEDLTGVHLPRGSTGNPN